jgi:hypothetical protein
VGHSKITTCCAALIRCEVLIKLIEREVEGDSGEGHARTKGRKTKEANTPGKHAAAEQQGQGVLPGFPILDGTVKIKSFNQIMKNV